MDSTDPSAFINLINAYHDDKGRLRDRINVLLRYRWLILLTFCTTVAIVLFFTFKQVPIYQATASIQIQLQGGGPSDFFSDVSGMQKAVKFDTEVEILKSHTLAEAAVRRLRYQLQLTPSYNGLAVLYRTITARLPWSVHIPYISLPRQPAVSLRHVEVGDIAAPGSVYHQFSAAGSVRGAERGRETRDWQG